MKGPPLENPGHVDLKLYRIWMGMTERQLGAALALGRNGTELVHRWEEADSGVVPTSLAWAAMRYLILLVGAYRKLAETHHPDAATLRGMLPENFQ